MAMAMAAAQQIGSSNAEKGPENQKPSWEIKQLKLDPKGQAPSGVLQEIARLERHLFPKHESLASSLEFEVKKKHSGLLYALPNQGRADDPAREVAGYVMYSFPSSMVASITKLAVKDCFRRQGCGQSLLKAAICICRTRPIHRVSLHVDPARTPAIALYRKIGFNIDILVHSYYAPQRDAYRMYLDFDIE